MNKNKLVLIIDGNWLLMSRLSAIINKYKNDYEALRPNLKLLMIQSIKLVLRQFQNIDNIMFVSDGGSWRTSLKQPQFMVDKCNDNIPEYMNIEYKGTREQATDINWEKVFNIYEELLQEIQQHNINIFHERDIEGDDWCYYLSTELNNNDINCIIWSKDKDLQQLVKINNNKCFTIWWNKENGAYIENYEEEHLDFLMNYGFTINEEILNNIIKNVINVNKIDPSHIVIDKIIRGDLSDNILPIILKRSNVKTSTRKYRCSVKDIDFSLDYKNDKDVYSFLDNLCNSKKYKNKTLDSFEDIYEHFIYNRSLVALTDSSYPKEIKDKFNKYSSYNSPSNIMDNIIELENIYSAERHNLKNILDFI